MLDPRENMSHTPPPPQVPLPWTRVDLEQRLGFRGARFTRVNNLLACIIGSILTVLFYLALIPLRDTMLSALYDSFVHRGPCPPFTAWFSWWALAILFLKWRKLKVQRRALAYQLVPAGYDFVLSSANVEVVTDQIYSTVDDPKHFILFNRIMIALSNLRNLGRVTDVDEILRSQAEQDESSMQTSYALVQFFVWAIPVLGFIGTVIGLSQAIGEFGKVLGGATEVSELTVALRGVTAGLSSAFETTLQALVAALFIQLLLTFLRKSEEEFLDECAEYCVRNVVGKLRIMPFEQEVS
jgi:biopolymer transport protein ExbB/TolQ